MKMLKASLFILILGLTLYPIAELSRLIINYYQDVEQNSKFLFELGFMWAGYIVALGIVAYILLKWDNKKGKIK